MKDMDLTLDNDESLKVGAYLGEIPSSFVRVFVWKESADELSVAVEVGGIESFSFTVSDRGKRLTVDKDTYVNGG